MTIGKTIPAALAALGLLAGTASSGHPSDLAGVWRGTRAFGPELAGPVTLYRTRENRWVMEIAGLRQPMTAQDGKLEAEFPAGSGRFAGWLGSDGEVHGLWTQPGVVAMFGQRFESPVHLEVSEPNVWTGELRPLVDRLQVYFVLNPREDGRLTAFIRNPEMNFGRIFRFTEVIREGNELDFRGTLAWRTDEDPRSFMTGRYLPEHEMMTVFIESLGGHYDLTRLDPAAPNAFLPRPEGASTTVRPPPALDDGWSTAVPEDVGLEREPLQALVERIASLPLDRVDALHVNAVLIARHGKLVFEEYFHGLHRDRPHDVRSASKSMTSLMAGAAIRHDQLSLETPVYATLRPHDAADRDPRTRRMTLEHLLTMSSGLACDDWDPESPGGEDRMQNQDDPDWYGYTLALPMVHEPGNHAAYCSAGTNLAGGVIARRMEMRLTRVFDRYLARPMDITHYHVNLMPTGEAYAGGGMRLTARDFLKFGQLVLDDGQWRGRQLLPAGYAADALTARHTLGSRKEGYGLGWWLFKYAHGGHEHEAFYAGGNGGNYIIGIPDLELVIAILGSNYGQAVMHETKYEYVPKFILEAIAAPEAGPPESGQGK